jgi:hypothetical protein
MDKQEILELMTAFRSSKLKHMTLEDGDFNFSNWKQTYMQKLRDFFSKSRSNGDVVSAIGT